MGVGEMLQTRANLAGRARLHSAFPFLVPVFRYSSFLLGRNAACPQHIAEGRLDVGGDAGERFAG